MTDTLTYRLMGKGSLGPAHPLHNPAVDVTLLRNGAREEKVVMPSGKEGHLYAMRRGYSPCPEEMQNFLQSERYQELCATVRYEESGL